MYYLKSREIIKRKTAPIASLALREKVLVNCGLKILVGILIRLSPQLGGQARDLEKCIITLKISDGEPVLNYYIGTLYMYREIEL